MMRMSHGVVLSVLALLVLGVVMVNSAGLSVPPDPALLESGAMSQKAFEKAERLYDGGITVDKVFYGRPAIIAFLSLVAMFFASRIDLEWLRRLRGWASPIPWILGLTVVMLVLTHVPGIGRSVNGAARWIGPSWLGFQPSELAKWGMLMVAAWFCVQHADRIRSFKRGFVPALCVLGGIVALIGKEDLGTAVLVFASCTAILLVGGMRIMHLALLVPVGVAGAIAAVLTSQYRVNRLIAFSNPWQEPEGIGYHVIQSMSAISGGGLSGHGLGNGLQKFGYLPEDTTDFIFAVICEELGIAGALLVVLLFAGLLLCGLAIVNRGAKRAEADAIVPPFSRLFGLGVLLTIGMQALINLLVVTGMAPTKGIALPFLSSGGSGWVATGFSIGLLLSIERHARKREQALGLRSEEEVKTQGSEANAASAASVVAA
jgi:cell division protein FtsW